ncbi:tripartite tricarboxylate transporter TctB family protein [uncultured Methylobacterium sp.]|uniref:tripartite tricarboxylate transporter TctB family protein n=1 Tax=uncultured Methylobacterium sp. TaxID=157278 RepID=UPI0035CA007C
MLHSIQRHRERYAGGLTALIGLGAIAESATYGLGTLAAIGPGAFPLAMGVILLACGLGIGLSEEESSDAHDHDRVDLTRPEWRGWGCIAGGMLAFLLLARTAGLFPGTFACVFISAMGDRTTTLRGACILATLIAAFGCALFYYGLHIQLPPFVWSVS